MDTPKHLDKPKHLNALRAFEASARHQSFSLAAKELNVTPAAVGQLVRTLEDYLGYALFHRQVSGKNRLIATELAASVLPDIRAGFDQLGRSLERLKQGAAQDRLTIAVSPAFAAKWLLPRIDRFQQQYPALSVRLDTNLKPVDFVTDNIDIGVRYGAGHWPGLTSVKLMDEQVYPVCSPEFLQQLDEDYCEHFSLSDLIDQTLIDDLSMETHADFPTWEKWLQQAGVKNVTAKRRMQINNAAAVLQAAMDGQGIALARSVMAQADIQSGRLFHLFPHIYFDSPLAYYMVYRPELANQAHIAAFRAWLMAETQQHP